MPHINYKRNETRSKQRSCHKNKLRRLKKEFKKNRNKALRHQSSQAIKSAIDKNLDWDDVIFPLLDEVDDWWNYD